MRSICNQGNDLAVQIQHHIFRSKKFHAFLVSFHFLVQTPFYVVEFWMFYYLIWMMLKRLIVYHSGGIIVSNCLSLVSLFSSDSFHFLVQTPNIFNSSKVSNMD